MIMHGLHAVVGPRPVVKFNYRTIVAQHWTGAQEKVSATGLEALAICKCFQPAWRHKGTTLSCFLTLLLSTTTFLKQSSWHQNGVNFSHALVLLSKIGVVSTGSLFGGFTMIVPTGPLVVSEFSQFSESVSLPGGLPPATDPRETL